MTPVTMIIFAHFEDEQHCFYCVTYAGLLCASMARIFKQLSKILTAYD